MAEWLALAHRRRTEMHFPRGQILAVCLQLVSDGIPLPHILAAVGLSELHAMAPRSHPPEVFRSVPPTARAACAAVSSAADYMAPAHDLFTQNDLVLAIRRRSAQFASLGSISVRTKRKLHVPRPFAKMGPAQRIRSLNSSAIVPLVLHRHIKDSIHDNSTKQAWGSLPGMASGFRCYTAFCELRNVTPFPARDEVVIHRSSVSNNAATFANYISLMVE